MSAASRTWLTGITATGPNAGAGGAQVNKISAGQRTAYLGANENPLGHWNKHKAELPELCNSKQYVEEIHSLVTNLLADALTKARGAGTLVYDRATNIFAVRGADGASKTMLGPTDGINY